MLVLKKVLAVLLFRLVVTPTTPSHLLAHIQHRFNMAHYAKVNNGIVEQVIVAEADFFDSFVDTTPGEWIQTSYNTRGGQHPEGRPLRKNFAGIGYTYDRVRDAFIPPQPYDSWLLNEDTCLWEAPVAMPEDGQIYDWDEATTSWVAREVTE
jgi:hypothetical protein